jgi:hypothetical protein
VKYVDAGYASALVALLVYGVGLALRRRRLARALKVSEADQGLSGVARGEQL